MSLGLSNLTNTYFQNYIYHQSKVAGQSNSVHFNSVLAAKGTTYKEVASASNVEEYTEYLKLKYGNVMIQSVEKDQKSMDALGARTCGTGNIVIAPNILDKMANDPEKAAYYEKKIQYLFDSLPMHEAQLAAGGFEIHSRGMVIHPDGTVTYYISGDLTPEKKAKIEAAMKAEDEEKAKRRLEYLKRSQEAADKRKQIADINNQKQILSISAEVALGAYQANFIMSDTGIF